MASIEGGQHKRPATPIPRRLQLFRLGSVHLFFFACAFARSSALLCSLLSLSLSSLHPLSLLTLLLLSLLLPFLHSLNRPRVLPVLLNFSLLVSLFFSILYTNFCSWIKYRSPFPRRCSFISLTLVARYIKIDHCYRSQREGGGE